MAVEIANRTYLDIDGTVVECSSIEVTVNGEGKAVEVMNRRNRPIGHTLGVPKFGLTAEVPKTDDLDVDFYALQADGTKFSAVLEDDLGDIETYFDCQVYDVSRTSSANNEIVYRVTIGALDRIQS